MDILEAQRRLDLVPVFEPTLDITVTRAPTDKVTYTNVLKMIRDDNQDWWIALTDGIVLISNVNLTSMYFKVTS